MLSDIEISDADIDAFLLSYNETLSDGKRPFEFDEVRRAALMGWNDLQACPGSGKTTLVATKLMILAKKWNPKYQGICVLTHTNVACDEIRSRLEGNADGYKLLSYPHFIGTIQEFVNRFLGLPYIRNQYEFIRFSEEDIGCIEVRRANINSYQLQQICRNLYRQCNQANYEDIKDYLGSLHYINAAGDLRFFKQNNSEEVSRASSGSNRRKMLAALKEAMCKRGIFSYRDIYAFSEKLLTQNTELVSILQNRFPIVLIDEMQDTQQFQNELINTIFDSEGVIIQRFGDPDQAIFNNIGGEEPNDTFNGNGNLNILAHSHRFTNDIASKVATLSLSQIGTIDALSIPDPSCKHTIFLYNDQTKSGVLDAYAELIAKIDCRGEWAIVKAVGATEGEGGHISAYWRGFDKRKQVQKPHPEKLIDAVMRKWWNISSNSEFQYKLIVQTILDLMRVGEKLDTRNEPHKYFNKNSLKSWLYETQKYREFRSVITNWIMNSAPSKDQWANQISDLKALLELHINDNVNDFLAYNGASLTEGGKGEVSNTANVFVAVNGREVEVGTIHSVKGETHDATLILETKNHRNDLEIMLPFITGKLPSILLQNSALRSKPHHNANPPQNKQFLRQLYVAASRPRHLLCLAINEQNISEAQKDDLNNKGWELKVVES